MFVQPAHKHVVEHRKSIYQAQILRNERRVTVNPFVNQADQRRFSRPAFTHKRNFVARINLQRKRANDPLSAEGGRQAGKIKT